MAEIGTVIALGIILLFFLWAKDFYRHFKRRVKRKLQLPPQTSPSEAPPRPSSWRYKAQRRIESFRSQRRALNRVLIRPKKPINAEAYFNAFKHLEELVKRHRPSWRVFAEVNMGAFLFVDPQSNANKYIRKEAFASINSKRVDFLVIDGTGNPVIAVEYNGTGHAIDPLAASMRDEVKLSALTQAGIHLLTLDNIDATEVTKHKIIEALKSI